MSGTDCALELRDVRLALGGHVILSDVDLRVAAGEFIGVLGPNGAGKTTLLRAVLGLVPPQRGVIRVFGGPAARGSAAIAYLPQVRAAVTNVHLSGWDMLASAVDGQRLGLPILSRAHRAQVERALERVGARALARRPLAEVSGGERQRLLFAQTLIGQPRLLLLDEPLISLDPHHQGEIIRLVKSLQQQLGATVLFSAHELNPLLGVLDRVIYLGNGRAAIGTVDEVVTGPVLSRLYGMDIEVVRVNGRIFVMSGDHVLEHGEHRPGCAAGGLEDSHRHHAAV